MCTSGFAGMKPAADRDPDLSAAYPGFTVRLEPAYRLNELNIELTDKMVMIFQTVIIRV